jgi:predicted GIY-YIG superfamily endonuclease
MKMRQFFVYILASRPGGTIYVGVTNNLVRRIYEHKNGLVPGFTKRYGIDKLFTSKCTIRRIRRSNARKTSSIGRAPIRQGSSQRRTTGGAIYMTRFNSLDFGIAGTSPAMTAVCLAKRRILPASGER